MAQSGRDNFMSTLADGSDSFRSTLAGGSDSLRSALAGGHDYMFENCCDLCQQEELQKEAVGFCVDCQDYLCTECFRNHLKPKPCRNHVLLDQHQMPSREATNTHGHYVMDIKVMSMDDMATPYISGCVVLPGYKLVVVDSFNNKVKLIDLTHTNIVSQLKPGGYLSNITEVGSTQVAVTSHDTETIYVVNVKAKKLKLDCKVKVKGHCTGIVSITDKLVVSYYNPVKVEIINMKGKVIQIVVTETKGPELFTMPLHLAVSRDKQIIYISDKDRSTVTSVDLTGQVQATYTDDKLNEPRGLTVDSAGRVYVCGEASNNLLQMSTDLTEIQEFLQESNGVANPRSVCYCEATDMLYIGMCFRKIVKVYQLE